MEITKSIFYFVLAGLFEIGGGYLIWLWIREGKSIWYAVLGAVILVLYGIIPTLQQNQQQPQPRERDYFYVGSFMIFCIWNNS